MASFVWLVSILLWLWSNSSGWGQFGSGLPWSQAVPLDFRSAVSKSLFIFNVSYDFHLMCHLVVAKDLSR